MRVVLALTVLTCVLLGAPVRIAADVTYGELLTCVMDQTETVDPETMGHTLRPIRTLVEKRPKSETLVIAGLGTKRVTAKMKNYTLALGSEVYPMDERGSYKPTVNEDADWYYARSDQGITVLEIPRKGRPRVRVRLHNLGAVHYTFVGNCD